MAGSPCLGLLRELRQHDGRPGYSVIIPVMPSLVHILGLKHIGEAAGRSLCPCVLQVDANVMIWLRSLHGPCEASYLYNLTFGCLKLTFL